MDIVTPPTNSIHVLDPAIYIFIVNGNVYKDLHHLV